MAVDSFVGKAFEVTLLFFYLSCIPEHEEDELMLANAAGIL